MKAISHWKKMFAGVVLVGFLFPLVSQAGQWVDPNCSKRPLSDFLDAQGTTAFFFPPVKDMLAWTDLEFVNFGLVDYAGLASDYLESIGISLGTKVNGRVLECVRSDGTIMISVVLSTRKALGFAQSIQDLIDSNFDFLNTPTIFGAKAQDVSNGATPSLGPAHLRTSFTIADAGGPLPDIRIAFQDNPADFSPITLDVRSTTAGTLPDGTRAVMLIQQVASTDADGNLIFSREIVDIK